MKMRVRGNSIRLRLTQSEVAQFIETGAVTEKIEFGGDRDLTYQLRSSPDVQSVRADFDSACISIIIPQKDAGNWADSGEEVGINAEQILGNGKMLSLLIEKDFTCLEPRAGEDDLDTFPHPRDSKKC